MAQCRYPRECETAELITAVNDALPAHVNVLRSGKLSVVETKQLVPGILMPVLCQCALSLYAG